MPTPAPCASTRTAFAPFGFSQRPEVVSSFTEILTGMASLLATVPPADGPLRLFRLSRILRGVSAWRQLGRHIFYAGSTPCAACSNFLTLGTYHSGCISRHARRG